MQSISDSVLPDVSIEPSSPSLQTIVKKDLSAVSVARASFVNHRSITRRSDNIIRYDGSYGTETVSSPRYRELRCERELKRLQSQQTETEEQLVRMESELRESKFKVESLMEEVTTKKARIRDMEINEKLYQRTLEEMETKSAMMSKQLEQLQRHYEIQKERLITYKTSEEKWEETRANLDEALYSKNNAITLLERELRDVKDELANCLQGMKNAELDISRMQRENEELKRIAESERKDYQASIADWRCRFEKAEAENLITSATSVERNAAMALEMREKIDEAQRLQNLLDEEKRTTQEREKELSRVFQERAEALECTIADGQRTIEDLRDQLVILTEDKDRLENEKIQIGDIMERKTEVLREALLIMDGMHDEVSSLTRSYLEEREQNDGVNGGDNPDPYSDLLHVMSIVETYCRQFENLELRLAVDDHEMCKNIRGTDLTETVNDLQYRLFAADQKRAAFEKERREMEHCMRQLQKSESEAKSENVLLKEKTSHLQEECAQLKEETENLRSSVLELKQEVTSKSYKISEISEAVTKHFYVHILQFCYAIGRKTLFFESTARGIHSSQCAPCGSALKRGM
ncbi:hypothetical protein NECAME_07616 [Necator americanus]|uniref:Uncharacterized protein n=1 Tax=Necator americanus TaxID=51031 RepID=W2TPP0_NECAM|nr:hypothetical protein NECAME_07616 [Necator americanus]ETN82962.1 hypothetical protein NECAME_07616 [Necator americanus]